MSPTRRAVDLVGRRLAIEVPATTANLGPGFDCLALALDLVNQVEVEALAPGEAAAVEVLGEGAGQLPTGRRNRFLATLIDTLTRAGLDADALGWRVAMDNAIPVSRGLGSSASATIAALLAADALLDGALGPQGILERATQEEGHPDNAAAALLGGFCVVAMVDGHPRAVRLDPPPGLRAALFIPDRPLPTAEMRAALPSSVPFGDAVHNVGAAALAVAAVSGGHLDLLGAAMQDRLHEPYRAAVYPELPELMAAARAAGALGACLSGAGSTVIAFDRGGGQAEAVAAAMAERAAQLGLDGRALVLDARARGATLAASAVGEV